MRLMLAAIERGADGVTLAELEVALDGEALRLEGLGVDLGHERRLREAGRADGDRRAGRQPGCLALDWLLRPLPASRR